MRKYLNKILIAFTAIFTLCITIIFNENNKTYASESIDYSLYFNDKPLTSNLLDINTFDWGYEYQGSVGYTYLSPENDSYFRYLIDIDITKGNYFAFRFSPTAPDYVVKVVVVLDENEKVLQIYNPNELMFCSDELPSEAKFIGLSVCMYNVEVYHGVTNYDAYIEFMKSSNAYVIQRSTVFTISELNDSLYEPFISTNILKDYTYNNAYTEGYLIGKAESGSSDDTALEESYNEGYTAGYDEGYWKGYEEGGTVKYNEGYAAGLADNTAYDSGYEEGYDIGYDEGHSEGYQEGHKVGVASVDITTDNQASYNEGYNTGSEEGYNDGYTAGKTDGYTDGYYDGNLAGQESVDITTDNQASYDEGYAAGVEASDSYDNGYADGLKDEENNQLNYDMGFEAATTENSLDPMTVIFSSIAALGVLGIVIFIVKKIRG